MLMYNLFTPLFITALECSSLDTLIFFFFPLALLLGVEAVEQVF